MLKWFGWIIFVLLAFVAGVFVLYVRVNTVIGVSTGIDYEFTPLQESFEPIYETVESVAVRYGLRNSGQRTGDPTAGVWNMSAGFLSNAKSELNVRVETSPRDEADARKKTGYLSVSTLDADTSDEWQHIAKELESELRTKVKFTKVKVQLDPKVYGACSSNERPTQFDSICTIPLASPVDFEGLKSMLERQRAARR
jgi:hypothetical protein